MNWVSKAQKNVTIPSTEAEYVGVSEICKEILFMIYILQFLDEKITLPVKILVDNIGAIYIAENAVTKRTKHIDTRYHVIQEYVSDGVVELCFVESVENIADIFTKNVCKMIYHGITSKLITNMK